MMDLLSLFFDPQGTGVFLLFGGLLFVATMFVVACDLITGVKRAKKQGIYRTSRKLRRTVEKISNYTMFLLLCFVADAVLHTAFHLLDISWFNLPVPILGLVFFVYVLWIEVKSIIENTTNDKDRQTLKGAEQLIEILAKKYGNEFIVKAFTDIRDQSRKNKGLAPEDSFSPMENDINEENVDLT